MRLLEHASLLWQPETTDAIRSRMGRHWANPDHEPAAYSGLLESLPFFAARMRAKCVLHQQLRLTSVISGLRRDSANWPERRRKTAAKSLNNS